MGQALLPQQIRQIREAFGLSSSQFAATLGVHPTTVSRWENSRVPVYVEGTAWTVLTALWRRLDEDKRSKISAAKQGEEITQALLFGGAVVALALLVAFAAKK